VVPRAVGLDVAPVELPAGQPFAGRDGLQHGAVGKSAAAEIVDRARAGVAEKRPQRAHEIGGVDVVADLFALVAVHGIGLPGQGALHEIGQESVQRHAGMIGPGQAAAPETGGAQAEIAAVFLHEQIGRHLGNPEKAMQAGIDGHGFVDTVRSPGMAGGQLPAGGRFLQRQAVWRVAVDLVGAGEEKRRLGTMTAGGFEQNLRTVGIDGKIGERLAGGPIMGGLGRTVDNQGDVASQFGKKRIDGRPVANVEIPVPIAGHLPEQPIPVPGRTGLGAEKHAP